jgi:hypothetical protein
MKTKPPLGKYVLPPSSGYKTFIPVYETTWHYILKGLYLKASAHTSELNGTEMKKRFTSPSKLCSLNCVIRRLVLGGKVLLKQVAEDVSGVTKIIHNLKDTT